MEKTEIDKIIGAVKVRIAAEYLKSRLHEKKAGGHGKSRAKQMGIFNQEKGGQKK